MILRYLSLLGDAPMAFVILIGAFGASLLVGLIFHEFCHAFVADRLGDRTPRLLGRLTLNPKAHYDPIGTTLIFFAGFGWAKPVPVNPANTANPRRAMTLIALAGPLSNLVMAGLAGLPIKLGLVPFYHPFVSAGSARFWAEVWTASPADMAGLFLGTVLLLNVFLAVFNMLPVPPLDGSRVLGGLLPLPLAREYARLEPWGMGILMLIILAPFITNGQFSLLTITGPLIELLLRAFAGEAGGVVLG
ncbi:MAG: site-2 protease family protein [Dehalococcoidia bacterium]|nr:site-2 protease family protein [Dehalococcoidia bacterium]